MGLVGAVKNKVIGNIIAKLAASEPKTTLLGAALAALIAANVNYDKLLQFDPQEIAKAVAALLVALLGYFTNHKAVTG